MTTISDAALQSVLLQGFQRTQSAVEATQIQLSSGDEFQTFGEFGSDALRLLSSEGVVTRAGAFETAAEIAVTRLQSQETSLTTIAESVGNVQQNLIQTLATGASELLLPQVEVAAQQILSALNVSVGGVFLFGGDNGTVPPVAASTLTDIAGADLSTIFNDGNPLQLAVEEGVLISAGPRASDFASDILTGLQNLATAQDTLGPFDGDLTAAQRTFLVNANAFFTDIAANLNQTLGLNGVSLAQASEAVTRNGNARDLAEIVAADIENVDIAEALARLNADQVALEASAFALAQATQVSLLDFL